MTWLRRAGSPTAGCIGHRARTASDQTEFNNSTRLDNNNLPHSLHSATLQSRAACMHVTRAQPACTISTRPYMSPDAHRPMHIATISQYYQGWGDPRELRPPEGRTWGRSSRPTIPVTAHTLSNKCAVSPPHCPRCPPQHYLNTSSKDAPHGARMISRVLSSELPLYSVDAGMVIFVILVPLKASLPIDVTDEGMHGERAGQRGAALEGVITDRRDRRGDAW